MHPELPALARREVQTNEVRRSWTLVPCFLQAAHRLDARAFDLLELGASAGLNLLWDRYRHRYEAGAWGPADGRLRLDGEERQPVPAELLAAAPRVRRRVGIDRDPIALTTEEGALRLRSFVWPDQDGRLERLDRAIETVRSDPPELVRGDLAQTLPDVLAARAADVPTLVFMTGVLGYLDERVWERVQGALEESGRAGGLAFVWSERPAADVHTHWGLWLRVWPGAAEPELLAEADYHGAWLLWRG